MATMYPIVRQVFGYATISKEAYQSARKELDNVLTVLDEHLKSNAYLGGK